jgi:hypothetical protein
MLDQSVFKFSKKRFKHTDIHVMYALFIYRILRVTFSKQKKQKKT